MKIEDVRVGRKPLVRAKAAEVDALASELWITFTPGYREYVTRLGEGVLGSFVRIYSPWRIKTELAEWRRRISKYWFWEQGRKVLPKERAVECVIIGDTVDGDELVFHPARADRLFILPRHSERVFEVRGDMLSALEWMCRSGELTEAFDEMDFEAFDSGDEAEPREGTGGVADPDGESLDEIVELAKRWARRHRAKRLAIKEMKTEIPDDANAELLYEGIVIGGPGLEAGYGIGWKIRDGKSGRDEGIFRWHGNEDSSGAAFEPVKRR